MCKSCEEATSMSVSNVMPPALSTRVNLVLKTTMSPNEATAKINDILSQHFEGFSMERLAIEIW